MANSTVSVDWEHNRGNIEDCVSEPKDYLFHTRTSQIDARVRDIPLEMKTQATLWESHTGKNDSRFEMYKQSNRKAISLEQVLVLRFIFVPHILFLTTQKEESGWPGGKLSLL